MAKLNEISTVKPKFHVGGTVPPELFVDRTTALEQCKMTLLEQGGNVLVVGKRKIGKTSFVSKVKSEIDKENVLSVDVNLVPYNQNPGGFLQEILLYLCYEVGEKVFKKTTSDLLASLGTEPHKLKEEFRRFHKIYKLTRGLNISRSSKASLDARVKIPFADGGAETEKQEQLDIGVIYPHEFIELAKELVNICQNANYKSIVIIADEANRLAAEVSKEILRSYFDILASKQIQFVFVADVRLVDYKPIEDIFECTINIGPFSSIEHIHQLLNRYYQQYTQKKFHDDFTENAVDKIWELSKGHPIIIQMLSNEALKRKILEKKDIVDDVDILQTWVKMLEKDSGLINLID